MAHHENAMNTNDVIMSRKKTVISFPYIVLCSTVRSTFVFCVDNDLLKRNNLICPQDYITKQAPLMEAPTGTCVSSV